MTHVLCDLDGVIYRGDTPLPGAAEALRRLTNAGARVVFVTNNSTRTPSQAADKIRRITGVAVDSEQMATSSQAAASMLTAEDGPALVVGEDGVHAAVLERGLETTDDPERARSVVVGMFWGMTYNDIARAAEAVRRGARFVATNTDPTYPIEDGLLPGAGSLVAAIATASGRDAEVAGKPHEPMHRLLRSRGIDRAWVVGDRLDTDIALADNEPGWSSILVKTGVTQGSDGTDRADHVVANFEEAVEVILSLSDQP
ncbi:MAG: HAD-IIA family hydrolase [Actinomycetota bacterium]|nr:HAD-IIA family hydrolase [Actinomycetota bacterium]